MIDPADPAAVRARAAERLFAEGRARESASIYREIAEDATDDDVAAAVVAWHNLAVVEQHLGRIEAAEVALLEAMRFVERVREHPLRGFVLRKLGELYVAMGNDDKAAALLDRALRDASSARVGAIRFAEMAIDLAALHRRNQHAERGLDVLHFALHRMNDFVADDGADERELLPWRAIVSLPEPPPARAKSPYRDAGRSHAPRATTIGRILLLEERSALRAARGELEASVDDGLAALDLRDTLDETHATATIEAAQLLARRASRGGRWADAATLLERVCNHPSLADEERVAAWIDHGDACSALDRFDEAERSFHTARSLAGAPSVRLALGLASSRIRRGDGAGAMQALDEGRSTATTTAESAAFHHLTAEAALLLDDVERASAEAKRAILLLDRRGDATRLPAALDTLGEAMRRMGDRVGAASAFDRALTLLATRTPLDRRAVAEVTLHVAQLLEDEGLRDEAEERRAHAREISRSS